MGEERQVEKKKLPDHDGNGSLKCELDHRW